MEAIFFFSCFTEFCGFLSYSNRNQPELDPCPLPPWPPSHLPPHPSCSLSQSPCWSSLSHTANSQWLSILHVLVYMFPWFLKAMYRYFGQKKGRSEPRGGNYTCKNPQQNRKKKRGGYFAWTVGVWWVATEGLWCSGEGSKISKMGLGPNCANLENQWGHLSFYYRFLETMGERA